MNKLIAFICILLFLGGCRAGQEITADPEPPQPRPPLIDRELFFDAPAYDQARISPDGNYVSFRKPLDGMMNIWVKGIDEPLEAARPMTSDTTRPVSGYFWSRDSRFILYVQDKGDGDLHILAVDHLEVPEAGNQSPPARDLTDIGEVRAQILAVPRDDPDYIIIGLNDRDPRLHDVYRLHLETGNREMLIENKENISGWYFDEAGNIRNAIRQTPDGGTEILAIDGDQLDRVYSVNAEESATIIRYHEDYERVYMVTNKGDADLSRLVLFNPGTGEEELVAVDPEEEVDFGGVVFSDATNEILATCFTGERQRIYPENAGFEHDLRTIRNKVGEGQITIGSQTAEEDIWIVNVSKDTDPGSAYVYDRNNEHLERLYQSRPNLDSDHLSVMQSIRYTARDGMEIPAYLTLPKGVPHENLPLIVHPHGGPWARDTWGYDPTAQFLANRGYAVLQPNFRGSTGYGKAFLNAGNKKWGTGAMQHDITDGVEYLIDQGIADAGRTGIYGGSYGGYAALAGLAFTPDLYAAGVSFTGPSNIITLLNSIPPCPDPVRKTFSVRVGDPDDPADRERLIEQSPLFSAEQMKAPLMIIQGANDRRVMKTESDQIVAALGDLGREVEYLVAPDEGHGFADRVNRLAYIAAMERFLSVHLGGRYQQSMDDEVWRRLGEIRETITAISLPDNGIDRHEAKTAPLPAVSGQRLRSGTLEYASRLESQGEELEMDVTRSLSRENYNGQPVWRLVEHARMPMGEIRDTIDVRRDNLLPVRRSTLQGPMTLDIHYSETGIDGNITQSGRITPLSADLDAPVFADGSGLHLTLSLLPLTETYATTFRIYDVISLEVKPMHLEVIGSETITVPAGSFETFKIEITPLDNDSGKQTVWIGSDASRNVIRVRAVLPGEMGGGSIVTELVQGNR
ncbi:MAG: prolyl oligopeptidase family serine peptidase [Balneolales bacterium]